MGADKLPYFVCLISVAVVMSVGCGKQSSLLFCSESRPCSDPEEFCDVLGEGQELKNACMLRPTCEDGCFSQVPICDEQDGTCRRCNAETNGDSNCKAVDETAPICGDNGSCRGCAGSIECASATPICADSGRCEACEPGAIGNTACRERDSLFPYCGNGACVECVVDSNCNDPDFPVCDAHVCRGCRKNRECNEDGRSGVCSQSSGRCLNADTIVYVDKENGSSDQDVECGAAPDGAACKTISKALAMLTAGGNTKTTIFVAGGTYSENLQIGIDVEIIGQDTVPLSTRITPADSKSALRIIDGAQLRIHDIWVYGGTKDGIDCDNASVSLTKTWVSDGQGNGIKAADCTIRVEDDSAIYLNRDSGLDVQGGVVTIIDSQVRENGFAGIVGEGGALTIANSSIEGNVVGISVVHGSLSVRSSKVVWSSLGGISVRNSDFSVVNTFIVGNGNSLLSLAGGIRIVNDEQARDIQEFSFNTVSHNSSTSATVVECNTKSNMIAENNIVFGGEQRQGVAGSCLWAYSNVEVGVTPGESGNIRADPLFLGRLTKPFQSESFHIVGNSPGINRANPTASLGEDYQGGKRPNGERSDMGADEFGAP